MLHSYFAEDARSQERDDKQRRRAGVGGGMSEERSVYLLCLQRGCFIDNGGGLKVDVAVISLVINASPVFGD